MYWIINYCTHNTTKSYNKNLSLFELDLREFGTNTTPLLQSCRSAHNDSTMAPPCEWYRLVSQPEIAKKSIKHPILAFKVIEFAANRKPVYNFLLVINSNLGLILHHYWDTATYWPKIANFAHPLSFRALVKFELMKKTLRFLKLKSSKQTMVKIWWF